MENEEDIQVDNLAENNDEKAMSPESHEKMYGYTPAKNPEEDEKIEEAMEKAEKVMKTVHRVPTYVDNIMYSEESDKPGALSKMFDQVKERIVGFFSTEKKEKETSEEKEIQDSSSLMITKNANGRYIWLARYSNNVRDVDNPPEIISSKSHKRFVEMVDKGVYPMPELWIWHTKEWKLGVATVVDYDEETGFAIAAGLIDEDKHEIAKSLAKVGDKLRVSHGMPYGSIVRDSNDPTIIIEHQTKEISPLPVGFEANPLTGFVMTAQKEKETMIDPKKSQEINKLGVPADQLADLEARNAADKAKVEEFGIETKGKADEETTVPEVPEAPPEQPETTDPVAETATEPETKEVPPALTVQDVADAIKSVVEPLIQQNAALIERLGTLESQVKELSATDEEKFQKEVALTPRESLFANLSVIGQSQAQIDGRTKEGKDAPTETPFNKESNSVGVPFLNNLDNWRDSFKDVAPRQ